jgi:hypothetical protein
MTIFSACPSARTTACPAFFAFSGGGTDFDSTTASAFERCIEQFDDWTM